MASIRSSEITDKRVYLNRRAFIASAAAAAGAALIADPQALSAVALAKADQSPASHGRKLTTVKSPLSTTEAPNTWEHLTTYNNFYEFGTRKDDPARTAPAFRPPQPWTIAIEGECAKQGTI